MNKYVDEQSAKRIINDVKDRVPIIEEGDNIQILKENNKYTISSIGGGDEIKDFVVKKYTRHEPEDVQYDYVLPEWKENAIYRLIFDTRYSPIYYVTDDRFLKKDMKFSDDTLIIGRKTTGYRSQYTPVYCGTSSPNVDLEVPIDGYNIEYADVIHFKHDYDAVSIFNKNTLEVIFYHRYEYGDNIETYKFTSADASKIKAKNGWCISFTDMGTQPSWEDRYAGVAIERLVYTKDAPCWDLVSSDSSSLDLIYSHKNDNTIHVTSSQKTNWNNKQNAITENNKLDYSLIDNTPSIPSKTSELENDSNFITEEDIPTIPTKVSELENDSGYTSNTGTITGIKMNGASKGTSGVVDLGTVITEHQSLSGYVPTTRKVNGQALSSDVTISVPTITDTYSATSSNGMSGKAVASAISGKANSSDIPTESTVSGWGFTKNTGTYSKPSTGIPKTDLASAVQTSLNNADSSYARSKIISATCSSEATAQQKVVTLPTNTTLVKGDILVISFTNTNTFSSTADNKITFKIGNDVYTPAYTRDGSYSTGTNTTMYGIANRDVYYFVDVTNKKLFFAGHSWDNNTTYSAFVKSGSTAKAGLVPAPPTTAGTSKFLREDGTWTTPPDTTYSNFVKSGSTAKAGLVPAPSTTAGTTKYLREDGTWVVPPNTTYSSKAAASGGTDTSLVTTGEKYTWNNKQDKVAKLGSTSKPVYVSADGTFAETKAYGGGTAVTFNGTSKAGSTASFYAPTTVGTSGQVLQSNGSGAPTWVDSTTTKAGLLDLIYPVGSIYMSEKNVSPQTFLGGTWVQIKDRFLLGVGDTYTTVTTGGSATKTIASGNLPKHTHKYNDYNTTYTVNGTTLSAAQSGLRVHSHRQGLNCAGPKCSDNLAGTEDTSSYATNFNWNVTNWYFCPEQGNWAATSSHTHSLTEGTTKYTARTSGDGEFANTALNVMPPYQTVYMWKRTA